MNFRVLLSFPVVIFLLAGSVVAQDRPALVDQMGWADRILTHGKIVSMDDRSAVPETRGHTYQAMAIKRQNIMALGTDEEILALAGSRTEIIDLEGRTVIPGLIQTHYHLFSPAASKYGPQFGLVDPSVKLTVVSETTPEATAKKLRDTIVNAIQAQNIPVGQWITVSLEENKENISGTTRTWLNIGKLNRRQIDAVTSKNPILVKGRSAGFFNAVAIKEFETVFPDWQEHTDFESGPGSAQNGYAAVPELSGLAFEFWWKDKPLADLAEVLRLQGADVIKRGITALGTRILYPRVIAAFHELNRNGRLPHRLAYYVESQRGNFFNLKSTQEFYRAAGASWTTHAAGNEMLWLNGMCHEIWDSTQNAVCMGPDVPAPPEVKAQERCPSPGTKSWESVRAGIVTGWRPAQIHGTSSHGARLFLRMVEQSMKEANYSVEYMRSLRMTLEHNQLLGNVPDVMEGIRKYGIILNVNTGYLAEVPDNIKYYGEQLRPFAMPVKTWIGQGVRVTFEAAGMDFWMPIYTLVTRKAYREGKEPAVLLPEEGIDRVTALKMATTWASEYLLAEDTLDTLETGKYADFAVLDRDFFTIPVEEIRNVRSLMTGLNGSIVYDNRSGKEQLPAPRPPALE